MSRNLSYVERRIGLIDSIRSLLSGDWQSRLCEVLTIVLLWLGLRYRTTKFSVSIDLL